MDRHVGNRSIRGQEQAVRAPRTCGAWRGNRHHAPRPTGCQACPSRRRPRPRKSTRSNAPHSYACRGDESGTVRLGGVEKISERGTEVTALVVDCSATMAWFMPGEAGADAEAVRTRITDEG